MGDVNGKLKVEDQESLDELFENLSLIQSEEIEKAEKVLEKAEEVDWPVEIIIDLEESTWNEYASNHPDEAKALENHLDLDETEKDDPEDKVDT